MFFRRASTVLKNGGKVYLRASGVGAVAGAGTGAAFGAFFTVPVFLGSCSGETTPQAVANGLKGVGSFFACSTATGAIIGGFPVTFPLALATGKIAEGISKREPSSFTQYRNRK